MTYEPTHNWGDQEDPYNIPFPHCDQWVLHAPGKCKHCDLYEDVQALFQRAGIPFSGEGGSPDELFRPREVIDRWPGNRPGPPVEGVMKDA